MDADRRDFQTLDNIWLLICKSADDEKHLRRQLQKMYA